MTLQTLSRVETIARLNDRTRLGLDRTSRTMMTSNLRATLSGDSVAEGIVAQAQLLKEIRSYEFGDDDGPERDFGTIDFRGNRVLFKIDYFDLDLHYGSEDPADASITRRVMTIMLASDY